MALVSNRLEKVHQSVHAIRMVQPRSYSADSQNLAWYTMDFNLKRQIENPGYRLETLLQRMIIGTTYKFAAAA